MKKAQKEIDSVLGQDVPTYELIKKLEYIRLIVVESLRLYPQPPLFIRRSLKPDKLPGGNKDDKDGYEIPPGIDIFVSVYNLHRSPYFWDRPNDFEPERFQRQKAVKASKDGPVLTHLGAPERCIRTRLFQIFPSCHLAADRESVSETNSPPWSRR